MLTITLERFCYSEMGTFGRLVGNELDVFTIERAWQENRPFESCIPEGFYLCERVTSPKHGDTFVVRHVIGRSGIVFHAANLAHELAGCIAPGLRLGALGGKWAVMDSRQAMAKFHQETADVDAFELRVTHYGL